MTKQNAIDKIKCFPSWNLDDEWLLEEEMQELSDMAVAALEKQIPKKPITHKDTNRADCPICSATVRGIKEPFGDWCSKCGQRLDWGENPKD